MEELEEIKGIIEWLPEKITSYQGKYSLGIKINKVFYNKYDEKEDLETILSTLKKGFEIKIKVDSLNVIKELEIISDQVKESKFGSDDMTNYEDLLDAAHEKADRLKLKMSMISRPVVSKRSLLDGSITEGPIVDFKNQQALYEAILTLRNDKGAVVQQFVDTGDAEGIVNEKIKDHFNRMASTRAKVRCYREFTNNAKVAVEETENPERKIEKDKKKK